MLCLNLLTDIYSWNNRTQTHRNIYFLRYFSLTTCLPSRQWEKLSWTQLYFPSSSEKGGGGRGGEEGEGKGNFGEKKNGCGYQKDSAHLLRFLSEYLKALREGGSSLLALSLPPSLKMNPIEWERWSDAETARNKALTGLKKPPFCMTTNTSLDELTARNTRGTPKCPLFSAAPTHRVKASITCGTLRAAPPPLAGVGSHGELDT